MAHNVSFKRTAMTRVENFVRQVGDMPSIMVFTRALHAVADRHSKTIPCPSAVVAFYDKKTTYRLFDTPEQGFVAYKEYKDEKAPCVFITMNSVVIKEGDNEII